MNFRSLFADRSVPSKVRGALNQPSSFETMTAKELEAYILSKFPGKNAFKEYSVQRFRYFFIMPPRHVLTGRTVTGGRMVYLNKSIADVIHGEWWHSGERCEKTGCFRCSTASNGIIISSKITEKKNILSIGFYFVSFDWPWLYSSNQTQLIRGPNGRELWYFCVSFQVWGGICFGFSRLALLCALPNDWEEDSYRAAPPRKMEIPAFSVVAWHGYLQQERYGWPG